LSLGAKWLMKYHIMRGVWQIIGSLLGYLILGAHLGAVGFPGSFSIQRGYGSEDDLEDIACWDDHFAGMPRRVVSDWGESQEVSLNASATALVFVYAFEGTVYEAGVNDLLEQLEACIELVDGIPYVSFGQVIDAWIAEEPAWRGPFIRALHQDLAGFDMPWTDMRCPWDELSHHLRYLTEGVQQRVDALREQTEAS